MKKIIVFVSFLTISYAVPAQKVYKYAASEKQPYGKLNPDAPPSTGDYALLIGRSRCKSYSKKQDGNWAAPVDMYWTFKYIMNGTAVHDETLKSDDGHTGSIRQYDPILDKWYVHYFTSKAPTPVLAVWEGGMKNDEIVLYRSQKAPNGTDGFYKIRFHNISEKSFDWIGAWTTPSENFTLETWKIECKKVNDD